MIDRNMTWIQKVNEIKQLCAEAKLPVDVEVDKTPQGIDAKLELGDIPFEKTGDVFDVNFNVNLILKVNKEKWAELLARMMLLSQKLCRDETRTFAGWVRVDDESDLIYQGTIVIKGLVNSDLLS